MNSRIELTDEQLRAQWEELRDAAPRERDWLRREIMERQLERLEREAVQRFCKSYIVAGV